MTLTPPLAGLTAAEDHLVVRWHEPGIAHVVLSNPDQRNAMSAAMTQAWSLAMSELAELPGLRAVLVSGEGKAFCAGGDLGWLAEGGSEGIAVLSHAGWTTSPQWLSVTELSVPTIAYLDGPAVGAGAAVALACDIRWAGPRARFSVPFTRLGLHSGMGTTYLLPHAVGPAMARDLLLTSRTLDVDEMLACGVVTRKIDSDQVLGDVEQIAVNAPIATRFTKRGLTPRAPQSLAEALRWEGLAQPATMTTEDVQEGLAAARSDDRPSFRIADRTGSVAGVVRPRFQDRHQDSDSGGDENAVLLRTSKTGVCVGTARSAPTVMAPAMVHPARAATLTTAGRDLLRASLVGCQHGQRDQHDGGSLDDPEAGLRERLDE